MDSGVQQEAGGLRQAESTAPTPPITTLIIDRIVHDLAFAPQRIETWPLARLVPYAKNAKQHGTDQVARIAASLAEFGWTVPCPLAADGELIAGHDRVLATTQLGLTEAPVAGSAVISPVCRRLIKKQQMR